MPLLGIISEIEMFGNFKNKEQATRVWTLLLAYNQNAKDWIYNMRYSGFARVRMASVAAIADAVADARRIVERVEKLPPHPWLVRMAVCAAPIWLAQT